jgi:hypothetical protein
MAKKQNAARSGSAKGKADPFGFGFDAQNLIEDSQKSLMDNSMQLSERDLQEMLKGALEDIDVDKMHFNEDDLNDPDLLAQLTGLEADDGSAKSAGLDKAPIDSRAEYLRQRIAVEKKHCLETRATGHVDEARLMLNEVKRLEHELHEHEQRTRGHDSARVEESVNRLHDAMMKDDINESLSFNTDTRHVTQSTAQPYVTHKTREETEDAQFEELEQSMMDLDSSVPVNVKTAVAPEDIMQQSPPLTRVRPQAVHEESLLDTSMRDADPEDEPKQIDQQLVDLLHTRSLEYKSFAAKFNKSGNKSAAIKYLRVGKTLDVMHQRASRGEHVDQSKIPPSAKDLSAPTPADNLSASVPVSRGTPTRGASHLTASVASPGHNVMSVPKDRSPKAKASSPARPELSGGVGDLDEELTASQMAGLADDPFAAHNPPRHEGESDEDYKRRRVFETIEKLLTAQISKTVNNALKYKNMGNKQEALKYLREKKDLTADLEQVTRAKQFPHVPPPLFKLDTIERREEIINPEVRMDELEFHIVRAFDMLPPSGYDTLDMYIYCEFPYPQNQVQKIRSNTVRKSVEPEFNFSGRVKIERKNVFARFLKSRKVTFEVYHQRSFLMRDVKLGQAELKLHDLLNQSTVHEFVEIAEGKKNVIGKLEIKARLREPLLAKQIRVTREQILKIEKHFPITSPPITQPSNTNVKQPSKTVTPVESTSPTTPVDEEPVRGVEVTPVPDIVVEPEKPSEGKDKEDFTSGPPSTESAPLSGQLTPVEPVTPMPVTPVDETPVKEVPVTPAQPSEAPNNNDVLDDWDSVDRIESNAVLEYEQQKVEQQMVLLKRAKKEIPEELQLRLNQVQMKMQILIIKIQKEILTMESYSELLQQKIKGDKELALKLKRAGNVEAAKEVLKRVNLMEKELANDE